MRNEVNCNKVDSNELEVDDQMLMVDTENKCHNNKHVIKQTIKVSREKHDGDQQLF